jgi:hypothetical protein
MMENELIDSDLRLENHRNVPIIRMATVIFIGVFAYGLVISWIFHSVVLLIISLIVSAPIPVVTVLNEYFRTPIQVDIREEGFQMRFKYSKQRFVPWSNVERITLGPDHPTGLIKSFKQGYVRVFGERLPYHFERKVAVAIVDKYESATGRRVVR